MSDTGQSINVLHCLNPFFAGIGGEESNDRGPQVEAGSRGPGRLLDKFLANKGKVVATLICGDNFFTAHESEVTATLAEAAKAYRIDLVIAGPAFSAGRYGLACGSLCQFANQQLGLPAVTAMSMENPGTEFRRKKVYILPTGESVKSMGEIVPRLMQFGVKLAQRRPLGPADVEGYLPRGIRYNERVAKTAAERAVDMVLAKMRGGPYQTEIRLEAQERVTPPAPLGPLDQAVVAIVTEMGFLPHGNPDRIASSRNKVWGRYSIAGMNAVSSDKFMYIHGGYNTQDVDQDPNRGVPVDALRDMEREGRIKQLVDEVFSTCGNGGALTEMKRIGQEMAREVKRRGATAVIIPATWGTGTRSGATLAKEIERAGMPAVVVTCLQDVAVQVGANHILRPHRSTFHSPFGVSDFDPDHERAWRRGAVEAALQSLQQPVDGPQVFEY